MLDLILSAAVILCDASGSLLEYTKDGRRQYVTKGCLPASDGAALHTDNSLKVAISSPAIQGRWDY